jgi:hypothetical protein
MNILQPIAIIVGVVSGVSGLVLGILNYIHQRDISRPRLVVRPRVLNFIDSDTGDTIFENAGVMEVHNVGHVSVYGSIIGFYLGRGIEALLPRSMNECCIVKNPESVNGIEWTRELRPQQVAMLRFNLDSLPDAKELRSAFAKTIVDDIFTAKRRDMRKFLKQYKEYRQKQSTDHK